MNRKLAIFLTYLMHPLFLVTVGAFMIFLLDRSYYYRFDLYRKLYYGGLLLFNTFIVPSLLILVLKKKGFIKSLMLESREERTMPLAISASTLLITYFMISTNNNASLPYLFNGYMLGVSLAMVSAAVINFFYKISLHAIALGGIAALLVILQRNPVIDLRVIIAFWLGLAALTGSARVYLDSHNPAQVYLGFVTGFLCVFLIMHI